MLLADTFGISLSLAFSMTLTFADRNKLLIFSKCNSEVFRLQWIIFHEFKCFFSKNCWCFFENSAKAFTSFVYIFWYRFCPKSILLHMCLVTKCWNSMCNALSVCGSSIQCSIIHALYISARLFIARPALNSVFKPSMISVRMTSFRELSGLSVLYSVFKIMLRTFWSSTFFSCSNCGRSELDTSKRLTLSCGAILHSYVSWTS